MNLTDPATIAFLGSICIGMTQAIRATKIDSRWLPFVSAGLGVVVMLGAALVTGTPITPDLLGIGLGLGAGATGVVTVAVHAGSRSTDGASTAKAGA